MNLDLDCLDSFLVLAEEKHYGRAAASLHITSSALTKRIQRLERQLEVRLLERDHGGVLTLTGAGERLAHDARPLLEHARTVHVAARGLGRDPARGRAGQGARPCVTLGLPDDGDTQAISLRDLQEVRHRLARDHPDHVLVFRKVPLPCLTPWLLEGRVDVQMTAGAVRDAAVHSTPVGAAPRLVAVPVRSELGEAEAVTLEEVADRPMLYDPRLPEEFMAPFWFGDLRPAGEANLVQITVSHATTVLRHVLRGDGVTVALASQARGLPPSLRVLPVLGAPPMTLHAARRTTDHSPVVGSLIEALRAVPLGFG